jgi:hypothetical protein
LSFRFLRAGGSRLRAKQGGSIEASFLALQRRSGRFSRPRRKAP